jgi:hypothetical protein
MNLINCESEIDEESRKKCRLLTSIDCSKNAAICGVENISTSTSAKGVSNG